MKRLLTILAFLLLAAPAMAFDGACQDGEPWQLARMNPAVLGASSGAACGALTTTRTDGTQRAPVSYNTNNELYMASSFQATASGDIKTVYIWIKDEGTPSTLPAYLYLYLCAGNGTNPNAIGTCTQSTTTNVTDPGGTYVKKKYKFAGFSITSGTEYWLIATSSYGSNNATNAFVIQHNGSVTGDHIFDSPDGANWNTWDTTGQWNLEITSCDE